MINNYAGGIGITSETERTPGIRKVESPSREEKGGTTCKRGNTTVADHRYYRSRLIYIITTNQGNFKLL